MGKPVIVHTREAEQDTRRILEEERASEAGGVMHCFTGTRDLALACLDLGFYVSFSGVLSFPKSADLRQVAAAVPLERTLAETDAPYLAPPLEVLDRSGRVVASRSAMIERAVDLSVSPYRELSDTRLAPGARIEVPVPDGPGAERARARLIVYPDHFLRRHVLHSQPSPTFRQGEGAAGRSPQAHPRILVCRLVDRTAPWGCPRIACSGGFG